VEPDRSVEESCVNDMAKMDGRTSSEVDVRGIFALRIGSTVGDS